MPLMILWLPVPAILSTSAGESIDVLANDVITPIGLPLNITGITTPPSFGSVVISDDMKEVIYIPPSSPLFVGDVTFEYEACADGGSCDDAIVTISVVPEVDANDDAVGIILSTSAGESIDVLSNDVTFPGGLSLSIATITTPPTFGSVVVSADKKEVLYTPPSSPLFVGDVTFEYEACTDDGSCDDAIVTITLEPKVVAADDSYTVLPPLSQSLDVLSNDVTTPAGHPLIVNSITTPPLAGTATISVDNSAIMYTPPSEDSFIGETFEYEACFDDGAGGLNQCDIAVVTISVDHVFIDQTDTPTLMPSDAPTSQAPTSQVPTSQPLSPSKAPSDTPSLQPTTSSPTLDPSSQPTTSLPSNTPTELPTETPTLLPTEFPTEYPTEVPTEIPTELPTSVPTLVQSQNPTLTPTSAPSLHPSTPPPVQILVCTSDKFFRDGADRTCEFYLPNNPQGPGQGCLGLNSTITSGTTVDNGNNIAATPHEACCFCGGGTIGPLSNSSA